MTAVYRARDWSDADAIRRMGYRPIHRDLNRRRSGTWRRMWLRLARGWA